MQYVLNTYSGSFSSIEAASATIAYANRIGATFAASEEEIPEGTPEEDILREDGLALYSNGLPSTARFLMAAGLF